MDSTKTTLGFAAAVIGMMLSACVPSKPVPPLATADDAPPVAAAYRTTFRNEAGEAQVNEWRFWRTTDRIERESPARANGELWLRTAGALFHTRLYHADSKGIEYRADDLAVTGATPSWTSLALLVDPAALDPLKDRSEGWSDGYPWRRYRGEIEGVKWDIRIRTDWMLPVSIRHDAGRGSETVELLQVHPRDKAPWEPTASEGYEIIDFADLGDRERDPFILRIQAEEGAEGAHGHGHAH